MQAAAIRRGAAAGFWLAFPVVPVLAGNFAHELGTFGTAVDPHEWDAAQWCILAGPLFGYGFLAGATWGVADEPGGRWWRVWASRRAAWVGLGPWLGLWTVAAGGLALMGAQRLGLDWPAGWPSAPGPAVAWAASVAGLAWVGFGWAAVARAALRRARRAGRLGRSWIAGLGLGSAFAGSLFGAFWIVTTTWRDYFFDPTVAP